MKPDWRHCWIACALAFVLTRPADGAPVKPDSLAKVQVTPSKQSMPQKTAAQKKSLPSAFDLEQAMTYRQSMKRWDAFVAEAAKRFNVPQTWIRAVMLAESGGHTMLTETQAMRSNAGAMGLMQLMPQTYDDMRKQYRLGGNPYDPHDNILAGAAYLSFLRARYGYPAMFAAYNDGPGNLEARMQNYGLLPAETRNYVAGVTNTILTGRAGHGAKVKFTRPDGTAVMIDAGAVASVRAAFPGEYAPGVQSVISAGRLHQGVRENLRVARAILRAHGGGV